MQTRSLVLAVALSLGFLAAVQAQPAPKPSADKAKTRLAVVPFEDLTGDEKMRQLVAGFSETLSAKFVRTGEFDVIERRQLAAIMKEQGFQGSGFADESTAMEIGKIAGVEKIIIGSVQKAGNQMKVVARVVSVKTGQAQTAHDVNGVVDEIFTM